MADNPYKDILRDAQLLDGEQIQRVIFDSMDGANQVFVVRGSQADPDGKSYPLVVPIQGIADEELLMLQVGTGYVVVGKIIKNSMEYVPLLTVHTFTGTVDPADFPVAPFRGLMGFDRNNSRLYIHDGVQWTYSHRFYIGALPSITGNIPGTAALNNLFTFLSDNGFIAMARPAR